LDPAWIRVAKLKSSLAPFFPFFPFFLEAGMNDYVAKPVRVAAIYATLGK